MQSLLQLFILVLGLQLMPVILISMYKSVKYVKKETVQVKVAKDKIMHPGNISRLNVSSYSDKIMLFIAIVQYKVRS